MINKVTLIGNLGQDPEVRTLENGTQVGRFSLATNESYKDKEGNWQNQVEWHNVVVWRDLAEKATHMKKGQTVYVEGKISYRKYTDKDGVERQITDIVASYFRLLEKRKSEDEDARFPSDQQSSSPINQVQGQRTQLEEPPKVDGDDLPF